MNLARKIGFLFALRRLTRLESLLGLFFFAYLSFLLDIINVSWAVLGVGFYFMICHYLSALILGKMAAV